LDWIDCAMQIAIVVAAIGPVHYQFAICGRGVVQAHQQIDQGGAEGPGVRKSTLRNWISLG
jgi:hypothetical protein